MMQINVLRGEELETGSTRLIAERFSANRSRTDSGCCSGCRKTSGANSAEASEEAEESPVPSAEGKPRRLKITDSKRRIATPVKGP